MYVWMEQVVLKNHIRCGKKNVKEISEYTGIGFLNVRIAGTDVTVPNCLTCKAIPSFLGSSGLTDEGLIPTGVGIYGHLNVYPTY